MSEQKRPPQADKPRKKCPRFCRYYDGTKPPINRRERVLCSGVGLWKPCPEYEACTGRKPPKIAPPVDKMIEFIDPALGNSVLGASPLDARYAGPDTVFPRPASESVLGILLWAVERRPMTLNELRTVVWRAGHEMTASKIRQEVLALRRQRHVHYNNGKWQAVACGGKKQ